MTGLDKEKAEKNLDVILERLQKSADFSLLRDYKKLYRKKVFLLRRADVAAWLFMYFDRLETPPAADIKEPAAKGRKTGSPKDKPLSGKSPQTAAADASPGDEHSKRLFISIGKNRRLFPQEIVALIMSKTSAAKEDIGRIKILDNYSFVQVKDTKADEIIEALTGIMFRGRTLSVNYAKPRGSDADGES